MYVCDPVMGDTGPGLYVPPDLLPVYREVRPSKHSYKWHRLLTMIRLYLSNEAVDRKV